jgi:FlaA1/EpsC-like NDP-sugar epimerase
VFVIDAALLAVFMIGASLLFSMADDYLRHTRARGKKAIVVGAGRHGAIALRELLLNPDLGCVPLGFVDDDEAKQRTRVEGYRVLGPIDHLARLLESHEPSVALVIVAIRSLSDDRYAGICEICDAHGVEVRRLRFSLDEVARRERSSGVVKFQKR